MKNTLQLIGEWLAKKFNQIESMFSDVKDKFDKIKDGSITAGNSEYAEKLGNEEDFYTKLLLDQKIDGHIKGVGYNPTTATFTFTFEDGSTKEIDTPLESTVKDGRFDEETDELVLVLVSDQEIRIPVSKFVQDIAPVVLYAAYTTLTNGNLRYILNADDKEKFKSYFDLNKSAPVVLRCRPADGEVTEWGDNKQEEIYLLESVEVKYPQYTMNFTKFNSSDRTIQRIYVRMSKISSSGAWTNNAPMGYIKKNVSEYRYDNYEPIESFDMNDFKESGGISALLREATETKPAIEGANIPEGFTDFQGYVLESSFGTTQVVTDAVLKKTMMRSSYYNADTRTTEWTSWMEIGRSSVDDEVIFTAVATENANEAMVYTLDEGQDKKFYDYVTAPSGKTAKFQVMYNNETNGTSNIKTYETVSLNCTLGSGAQYSLIFQNSTPSTKKTEFIRFRMDMSVLSDGDYLPVHLFVQNSVNVSSEYLRDRHDLYGVHDMNKLVDTGGVALLIDEETSVANIPEGFTEVTGFVLESVGINYDNAAVQFLYDHVQKRMMVRAGEVGRKGQSWSDWKEIGGGPSVQVVTEYPTDLSGYADGTIFIKEEAGV